MKHGVAMSFDQQHRRDRLQSPVSTSSFSKRRFFEGFILKRRDRCLYGIYKNSTSAFSHIESSVMPKSAMGRFDCIRRSESVQVSLSQTVRRIVFLVCQKRPLSACPRIFHAKVTVSHVTSEHIALSQTLPGLASLSIYA